MKLVVTQTNHGLYPETSLAASLIDHCSTCRYSQMENKRNERKNNKIDYVGPYYIPAFITETQSPFKYASIACTLRNIAEPLSWRERVNWQPCNSVVLDFLINTALPRLTAVTQ